jgi:hypothetical protein
VSLGTVDLMPASISVEQYLDELRLLRKPMTVKSAEQILNEYLGFADPSDVRFRDQERSGGGEGRDQ